MPVNHPTTIILGSEIPALDIPDIVSFMGQMVDSYSAGQPCRQIVNTGFHGLWEAARSAEIQEIYRSADLWIPDGISCKLIANLKGCKEAKRLAGIDFVRAFLETANDKGYKSFFYGGTEETLKQIVVNLDRQYPGHRIVGAFSPPFRPLSSGEEDEIIRMINTAKPDVLWVALGCPKQDIWIYKHKDRLQVPMAAGIGAIFNFLAGTVKRSPEWVARIGAEWLWRLLKEPGRLWRRDLIEGPRFLWHVARELIQEKSGAKPMPKGKA